MGDKPRNEILHNIDPVDTFWGNPDGYSHCRSAAFRRGDWKLLLGCPGNGDWVAAPESGSKTQSSSNQHNANSVFLFNITGDPQEKREISEQFPDVVRDLLGMIEKYNTTAVPARFPDPDLKSKPVNHGGVWRPWMD